MYRVRKQVYLFKGDGKDRIDSREGGTERDALYVKTVEVGICFPTQLEICYPG
jgi:hypothetical protein